MEPGSRYRKGLWTEEEDRILLDYVKANGRGRWSRIPRITGLRRCGKSCRLRWMNYLCPNVKRGDFTEEEDDLIIRLHNLLGNRWSLIAGRVPGRTDNQVKNHWNTHLCKKHGVKKICRKMSGTCISSTSTLMNIVHVQSREQALLEASNDEHVLTASQDSTNVHENPPLVGIQNPIDSISCSLDGRGFLDFVEEIPIDILWQEMGCFD